MRLLVSLIVIYSLISCSSDLDFRQVDGIEFTQNAMITGLYFQADQTQFLSAFSATEIDEISMVSTFDVFNGNYIQENLVKVVFEFELENTFDRNFEIDVTFLDNSNQRTSTITLQAFRNSKNTSLITFEDNDLDILKTSSFVNIKVKLLSDTNVIDINTPQEITLKSTIKFTLITS